MNLEELITKANNGDVESMIELTMYYADKNEWNDAIDWADKAAETGDVNGMYKAAALHNLRMSSLLGAGVPFWTTMKEDAQAIQKNAAVLIGACRNGTIELEEKIYSTLLRELKDALYCEAVICYCDDSNDYERAIHLLKNVDSTREQTLCGLCYFELSRHDDAMRVLDSVYHDDTYLSESKYPCEQIVFSTAMFAFSVMTRMNGNLDKAVLILNHGIQGLENDDAKEQLRKELGRYQKKTFGGWKFVG